jgi:hypothetical protein
MKSLSLLLVMGTVIGLSAQSAHAWGKKLDLSTLQGTWETSTNAQSGLACAMDISIAYDEKNATLDGSDLSSVPSASVFHFTNIDKGSKSTAEEAIPEHSEFQDDWVRTSVNSNSIQEEQVSHMISGTVTPDFMNDPMDTSGPVVNGMPVIPQMVTDNYATVKTTLQYNSKTKILVKKVSYSGMVDDSQTCAYERK